jgi:hypothetical protein
MYGCEEEDAMAMFRSGRSPTSMTMSHEDEDDDDEDDGIAGGTTSSTKVRWACSLPAHLCIFITNH